MEIETWDYSLGTWDLFMDWGGLRVTNWTTHYHSTLTLSVFYIVLLAKHLAPEIFNRDYQ